MNKEKQGKQEKQEKDDNFAFVKIYKDDVCINVYKIEAESYIQNGWSYKKQ